jgi:hypothetical protein
VRLLALLEQWLLLRLGGGSFLILRSHVAESIVAADGSLFAGLLEKDVLVCLDVNLLVLKRCQDAGASSGERLLLILEDAGLRRSPLRL